MTQTKGSTGRASTQSAGGKHGSNATAGQDQTATAAGEGKSPLGLNENTGEFRVGENIIFGMSNGNIKLRRSPQGDEVEVAEAVLAGAMIDLFFTDKFEGQYDTVSAPKKTA